MAARVLFAVLLAPAALVLVGPNRYGHSDRVERHLLPAVSTGPQDPAWSPDGKWIAFSMRGDIWKVPADGGDAVALTSGPAYHFEPAWSPDGTRVALSMDLDGNLEIGVVSADGGEVQRITTDPQVDIEPEWSRDGRSLFFVSARRGGFRIYRRELDTGAIAEVVRGIQPAVSPDGAELAYVASVRGRLGSGGLWRMALPDGEPELVHYEETEYRMKPAWMPGGQAFLYVSDQAGSNDVAIVPAGGGNPIVLTPDARDEYSPSPSPDGSRFAFVSNRTGSTTLYTVGAGGGPLANWRAVPIRRRQPGSGRLRVRVLGPGGQPVPARVQLLASDGRAYAPDGGFHRVIASTETHYFHTSGEATVELPAGRVSVETLRGFEYRPRSVTVDVAADDTAEVTLKLERLIDLPSMGWYSGDTHVHDLHQGRYGQTHESFFEQLVAEDLHMTWALIHMDGTRLMGRWSDLTGERHPLSTRDHVLQYAQEFRGSLGHIALLGVREYVLPFTGGAGNTAYDATAADWTYVDAARAQGGLGGFVHPYNRRVSSPQVAASTLIPVDVALGKGDFYDICALWSDELGSAELYYRLLNCGFRIAATSGTDNFSDVWRDPPPGAGRTYVRVEGPLTVESWLDGIRAGRTFGSTGPLVLLEVEGRQPGDEIALATGAAEALSVRAEAVSIAPMERLQILVNGEIATEVAAGGDPLHLQLDRTLAVPQGGWVAARVIGPSSRYITDSYAFAQTSPVYVVREGRPFRSAEDARFLLAAVDAIWSRAERHGWSSDHQREAFRQGVDRARRVYREIAAAGR